ncbi:peptidoglycan DD-metalloendopeptidase family protein [Haloimpatiens sp. FM7315]|uniref:peptidoglycan DD-metalloendopeptidase family protein n=1 Tax=Haloimpatiens sp. FM7315 TaxID=3298609 RepID=UPI0035A3AC52
MKKDIKIKSFFIIISLVCLFTLYYSIPNLFSYKVMLNNKYMCIVENKDKYLNIQKDIMNSLNRRFKNIEGEDKLKFKICLYSGDSTKREEIKESFFKYSCIKVDAYEVFLNSNFLGVLDNKEERNTLVSLLSEELKKQFTLKSINKFNVKNLELKKVKISLSKLNVEPKDEMEIVSKGILNAMDRVKVEFVATIEETKQIEPSTVVKSSKDIIIGKRKIKENGEKGIKKLSKEILVKDNKIVAKKIIREKVIKPCKDKVILIGSKKPTVLGSFAFARPSRGSVSSGFGKRNGKMHKGIDIASPMNTPIYAAYDGVVTFSGWQQGYGNIVIINHGNGFETRYGHCNSLIAKKGDKIKKTQLIAKVGSTGRSTGPHLHFEIRKNDQAIDPTPYIN